MTPQIAQGPEHMQTLTAIQDEYIAKVTACSTGHLLRVKRGIGYTPEQITQIIRAGSIARAKLTEIGYTPEQITQIIRDAHDMLVSSVDSVDTDTTQRGLAPR